ncbi:MAG TPA: oligoendopeptidase F [Thermomicrobiales bacterium]|nr:oligoendopeptidase F [Thermomicrobiales bacterium]
MTVTGDPATGQRAVPPRGAVPREFTWDLESVFPTDETWEHAFRDADARLAEMDGYRGTLGDAPEQLLGAMALRDDLYRAVDRVFVYANLRFSEDAGNDHYAALSDRAGGLRARFGAAVSWVDTELLAISNERIETFFQEEPRLEPYRHAVRRVQDQRAHVRSTEVEELLAQVSNPLDTYETIHTTLEDGDLPFGNIQDEQGVTVPLSQGNVEQYLQSRDRRVRRETWDTAADAYLGFADTFAATLSGGVKRDVFRAQARGYGSALEASLAPDAIPTEVFHNLIATVWKNLPTWHRYFRIRRHLLGLETLHPADLTAPLATEAPRVPFDEGVELILESLQPLGEEYVGITRQGIADRWVDRAPNLGKGGGAFSFGTHGVHPFISMNWRDDLESVSTLTHELGHSLHTYYATRSRPMAYWPYSMFLAETASNMHQALMGRHLLGQDQDENWLLTIVEERMSNYLRYFFTMPILARFELDCHQRVERGEALTAGSMSETLVGFYREAYGGEVELDEARTGITWARFSHLYTPFYVFQYATGISAAAALAEMVPSEGEPAVQRYLDLLRAASDGYPIDLLREAGIDMRSPEPVQRAFNILEGYVERLEGAVTKMI